MDRITKSLLTDFVRANSLESLPEDKAFEHYSGWLVASDHYSETFSTDDISTGSGGDCGIDCIALIVNGCLVTDPDEIADLEDTNGFIDATFVFVQSERSPSFDTSKIGQFGFGVRDFLSENPSLSQNDDVALAARTVSAIFERSSRFQKGNPQCFLYYVTTGRWTDDANLVARRDAVVSDLKDLNLFRSVSFECLGASDLQELDRNSKNAVSREITFSDRTVLPDLPGIEQAYIGVLPVPEFMKLIQNSNEEILTTLFYDNVRHWQQWNPVNTGIRDTLVDPERQVLFPLLNNGVTIVAKRVNATGNRFTLEDYQVVNGCQTSFVLHEVREDVSSDVYVPVRLIATDDADIRNSIIKATNRQTAVAEDQLLALSDFPKSLEAYFPTYEGRKQLFFERRSRQYNSVQGIEKVRVIDMRTMIRAFAATFLELPHRTTRNYKALLKAHLGTGIFNPEHKLEPYYFAGYAYYRLDFLFRNQVLPAELKAARYHLLMAARLIISNEPLPPMNSREMTRLCGTLCDALWDDNRSKEIFDDAADHVRAVAAGDLHRDNIRTEPFTDKLRARLVPTR